MSQPASSPRFPVKPLIDYGKRKGMTVRELERRGGCNLRSVTTVSLENADAMCIDALKVHPFEVYGEYYFDAA